MRRYRYLLTALAALFVLGAPVAADAATLLYPDLKTLPPRNLRFDRTDVSADSTGDLHNVLRFSNTVYNVGEGPVEIRATINPNLNPPSGTAYQRIYDTNGGHTDISLAPSTLYYHAVHKHYHFDHWGGYELWTKAGYDSWIASGETIGNPDLVGQKTTSCVEDEEFIKTVTAAIWPADYPPANCLPDANGVIAQGLSAGWGDTYDYYRFEQWIDLGQSTLADGTYVLRTVADPQNLVYESPSKSDSSRESVQDNSAITTFTVQNGAIVDSDAPTGTVTINHVDKTTSTATVSLDILGRDDVSGVDQFMVSNDGTSWATYNNTSFDSNYQTISWNLADAAHGGTNTAGTKTVCVMFKDAAGHWGPIQTDTIDYQPPPPPPPPASAYGQAVNADGPTAWWRLGEASGTTAADQIGTSPGTYAGGVTLGQPSLLSADTNPAATFNGSTGRVTIPDSPVLDFTNKLSIEAWIKPTSLPTSGVFRSILTKAEAYSLQFNGPRLEFTIIQSGVRKRLQAPSGAVVAGTTYHVVGTFDGTTQRLYLNGVQVASAALSGSASVTTKPVVIGSWDGTQEFFNGTIDEPALYGKVLTAAQVAAHYSAAGTVALNTPSGLAATPTSASQVNLTWSDNNGAGSGETGEVLERSTDSAFTAPTTIQLAAGTQSYSDTGLSPSTDYWYRVKGVASSTTSAYSNVAQATTQAPATYRGTVLNEHPVSYWRLDDASGTIAGDETVANPGTYTAPTLGVAGLLSTDADTAVGFDGTSSDVRIGQAGSLDLTGALTLEAWIKPASLPTAGVSRSILAKPGSYALQLVGPSAAFTIVQLGVRRTVMAPAGVIAAGGTYHLVGTFDGATERLYVNGVQVATSAVTGAADLTIGGVHIGSWDGASEFFGGTIDEAAVYSKVLDATSVAAHYNVSKPDLGTPTSLSAGASSSSQVDLHWVDNSGAETGQVLQRSTDATFSAPTSISLPANVQSYSDTGRTGATTYWYRIEATTASSSSAWSPTTSVTTLAPPTYASVVAADSPVSWWRLNEASGTTAADQESANPGTYLTGTTLGAASLLATAPTDKAVAFNGTTGAVRVNAATSLNFTNAFSLEAWIKPSSLPVSGAFASVLTKAESYSLQFNGPRLEFTVIQSGTRKRLQAPSGAIVAGGTYHVVGTFDGATQRLYVNGVQVASVALSGSASVTTNRLFVGSWNGSSEFFKGTVDEAAVYNKVLSPTSVAAHRQAGTTG